MKLKNATKFHICGLNQEKLLNVLCKNFTLSEINRSSKSETSFKCSYFAHKKIEKILKEHNVKIESVSHEGFACQIFKILSSYGLIAAILLFFVLYPIQFQFILQYEVIGTNSLPQSQVVNFVKEKFSSKKSEIDTEEIETSLLDNFDEISFASCIIKGQTLVINIKEKLLPEEIYGNFPPIVAVKDGKIREINLVSGTLSVKVGDFVRAGDVLVEPFTIDASGQIKKVEAKAEILAEVYSEGSIDHYETYIDISRTGRKVVQNEITLFGLSIYSFKEDLNFQMYEVETEEIDLSKNLFLPFKMKKNVFYELSQHTIVSDFEDVKEEFIAKAKQKALENCLHQDLIVDEFYTIRHIAGVTIVNFCVVTEEEICGYKT